MGRTAVEKDRVLRHDGLMITHLQPSFEMSPDTLWAVWTATDEGFVAVGVEGPVTQQWVLASAGDAGREEIRASAGTGFLAALCLADLQQCWETLKQMEEQLFGGPMNRWLPFALRSYALLVEGSEGKRAWVPLRARSQAHAHELGASLGQVVTSGQFKDLKATFEQGSTIFQEKDYRQVLVDVRPITPEHSPFWLIHRQSPHLAEDLRRLMGSSLLSDDL